MNFNPSSGEPAATIGGKVVVQRGHHQRHHTGIDANQQKFLLLKDGHGNLVKGLIGEQNANSTSNLQDYSEYQLSFR